VIFVFSATDGASRYFTDTWGGTLPPLKFKLAVYVLAPEGSVI
jgi:hypothetical protein